MSQEASQDRPLLIIVNGPPASGKSTLGKQVAGGIGVPYLSKDDIKEELHDSLGRTEPTLSRELGAASVRIMYSVARQVLNAGVGVVIENAFWRGVSKPDLSKLVALSNAVMVHCSASDEELIRRYVKRAEAGERHPVHDDANRVDDLRNALEQGTYDALDLDIPLIHVDTSNDFSPSVAEIIRRLRDRSVS